MCSNANEDAAQVEIQRLTKALTIMTTKFEAAKMVCDAYDGLISADTETVMSAYHRIIEGLEE
jgi:hypothetical protein